jgi:hypothetical protein
VSAMDIMLSGTISPAIKSIFSISQLLILMCREVGFIAHITTNYKKVITLNILSNQTFNLYIRSPGNLPLAWWPRTALGHLCSAALHLPPRPSSSRAATGVAGQRPGGTTTAAVSPRLGFRAAAAASAPALPAGDAAVDSDQRSANGGGGAGVPVLGRWARTGTSISYPASTRSSWDLPTA